MSSNGTTILPLTTYIQTNLRRSSRVKKEQMTVYRQHTCISCQRYVADEKHKSEVRKRRVNYFPFLVFIFLR